MKFFFIILLVLECYGLESNVDNDRKVKCFVMPRKILKVQGDTNVSWTCVLQVNTEVSRALDDRPLLFATLGGGMVAVDPSTGNVIWKLKDGK